MPYSMADNESEERIVNKSRMMKKLLSLLLMCSMTLALAPMTALMAAAQSGSDIGIFGEADGEMPDLSAMAADVMSMAEGMESTREMVTMSNGYGSNGKFLAQIDAPIAGSTPISNRAQLEAIKDNLSGNYHLTADIDLSGAQWVPIGDNSTNTNASRFTGTFDGQGYVIRNLTITGDYEYAGLFGYASSGATVKSVGLEGTNILVNRTTGYAYAAGISGYCFNSTISNCYNTGDVSSSSSIDAYAGGISGYNSTISNCYNTGDVSSSSFSLALAGGISGSSSSTTISNCYNTGYVSSSSSAAAAYAGGISGTSSSYPISECYNTGDVSSSSAYAAYAGGINGYSSSSPSVINSYWRLESNQIVNGVPRAGAEKRHVGDNADTTTGRLTDAQMRTAASFAGFDFDTVWEMRLDAPYPQLRGLPSSSGNGAEQPNSGGLLGDVNEDGTINIADVNLLYLNVRGRVTMTQSQLDAADVNKDGKVDIGDVNLLYLYVRGKMPAL